MKFLKKIDSLFDDSFEKTLKELQEDIKNRRKKFEEANDIYDLYINDPQVFKKKFIPFKEHDALLEQFEDLVVELNHYKKQNGKLKAENNYLRNKLKMANILLKESYLLINKLEDKIAKKAVNCLQKMASTISNISRSQKIEIIEIKEEIKEAEKEKSQLRNLMKETLKKNLSVDIKSKQTDIDNKKDWTINHKV